MKKAKKPSYARLIPLAKGRMVGLREAGMERKEIAKRVKKKDGSTPALLAVDGILQRFKEDPKWDGLEQRTAGGRPLDLTPHQVAKIKNILLKDVGKHVVSATHVKRNLKELRRIPYRTTQRTYQRLGYSYLSRRGKAAIGE